MGNILIRRREMAYTKAEQAGYVTDGLIFFLDGLDRGGVSGQWTDLVEGVTFTIDQYCTEYDNGVEFFKDGAQGTISCSTRPTALSWNSNKTIEAACSGVKPSQWLISPKGGGLGLACGAYGNNNWVNTNLRCDSQQLARWWTPGGTKLLSINNTNGIGDLKTLTRGTNDSWGTQNGATYLGKRQSGAATYSGRLYAIRVYNRILTVDEMKQNQRTDMARYGITI